MSKFKVGVQLFPQHTTTAALRSAWQAADQAGFDSIWVWDHFYPLFGPAEGEHFEAWTLLAAMAVDTTQAQFGAMVTGNGYRNPQLLADMARTINHLSAGRLILGLGAGWFEKDYAEYGYEFGTAPSRLRLLGQNLPLITDRLSKLNPAPIGRLPILIGGGGEKVTLKLTAQYADMWNLIGSPHDFSHKSDVLDEWCRRLDRDPRAIERTVTLPPNAAPGAGPQDYVTRGAQHVIVGVGHPFDLGPARELLASSR